MCQDAVADNYLLSHVAKHSSSIGQNPRAGSIELLDEELGASCLRNCTEHMTEMEKELTPNRKTSLKMHSHYDTCGGYVQILIT